LNFARLVSSQSKAVVFIVLLLCAAGVYASTQLPISIFPETDFPRVVIIVDNGEVTAGQTLVSVTRPIEEAMNGMPGIAHIRSTTERGATEIDLFFDWKTDIIQTLQLVQGRLSQLTATLPPTASIRQVARMTFAVFPILGYSLTSDTRDLASMHDLAVYAIRPNIARLPGVAQVSVAGGKTREFHVTIDPDRLSARNLTSQQVVDAIKNSNIIDSPGLIEENHKLELALVSGQPTDPDQLNDIVVATVNQAPVRISDVATVTPGVEPQYIIVTADGKPATLLNISRQPSANTVTVAEEVEQELKRMRPELPPDVKIAPFYDQSILVRASIDSVRDAILIGLLLSTVILFGFLRNWGTTLVAIVVIPVTVLVTILAMWLVGLSFNLMTLGGMAAAIGLVIDDAIVVVENIYTHYAAGLSVHEAVQRAMSEISAPIIGSTITPVVVFLPLTLLTGVTGVFFRSLALTMAVALLTSLVLALCFTPVLAERFVRRKERKEPPSALDGWQGDVAVVDAEIKEEEHRGILGKTMRGYEWILGHALDHRWAVIAVLVLAPILAYLTYSKLGSDFLPEFDEGAFVLDYWAPPGSSLSETNRMLQHVEGILKETPEVESYSRRTGLELGLAVTEPNRGDFLVKLKAKRKRASDDITDDIRKDIENSEPGLRVEFAGILGDMVGDLIGSPEPVEIKLFSEDAKALDQTAIKVHNVIRDVNGIVDSKNGVIVSGPAITFKIDPGRAAQMGVNTTDVAETVTTAMLGTPASAILQQGRLITVRAIMAGAADQSLETLRNLPIRSSGGALFRLGQVADIQYDPGQTEIHRDGLLTYVAVTGRLDKIDLGSAISEIQHRLAGKVTLPPGMNVEYGGLYEQQQESFRQLVLCLALAIVLVFITLLIEFRSFAHPISIVAGAVLALAGVLGALLVTGSTVNVVSQMGMIMVVGIVAKNGILMLDTVEEHLASGDNLREALMRSGRRRFRPVLMTSLAAMLGMAPLAVALGSGAAMLQPLAIAVIGGLAVALVLSLVVTPAIYAMLKGSQPAGSSPTSSPLSTPPAVG
jgi:hydrophobe/amphiphile efflux-1 (HAE1) family protein